MNSSFDMKILMLLLSLLLAGCQIADKNDEGPPSIIPGSTPKGAIASTWAYTLRSETKDESTCRSIAVDSDDNIYIAGSVIGAEPYDLNGDEVRGAFPNGDNFFIAKIRSGGGIAWIRASGSTAGLSGFNAVAADDDGNVYAVGYYWGSGEFKLSDSVRLPGSLQKQAFFAKFDASGNVVWARSAASKYSLEFNDLSVDGDGNATIVGQIMASGPYDLGNGVEVSYSPGGSHLFIAKYDNNGLAQWARTVASSGIESCFSSVSTDKDGNAYAAGYLSGSGTCVLADGISCSYGPYQTSNILAAKYSAQGDVLWAKPEEMDNGYSSSYASSYTSVCALPDGKAVLLGNMYGTNTYSLGGGQTISGDSLINNGLALYIDGEMNVIAGLCGGFGSDAVPMYSDVIADNGGVYIIGSIDYCFWLEVPMDKLGLIIKTDANGNPEWIKAYTGAPYISFKSAAVNSLGEVFVVGQSFEESNSAFVAKLK